MGLEIRNRLSSSLGLTLPATVVWNYPNLADLAEHLAEKLGHPPAAEEPRERPAALERVEALSETEAEAELLAELDQLGGLPGDGQT